MLFCTSLPTQSPPLPLMFVPQNVQSTHLSKSNSTVLPYEAVYSPLCPAPGSQHFLSLRTFVTATSGLPGSSTGRNNATLGTGSSHSPLSPQCTVCSLNHSGVLEECVAPTSPAGSSAHPALSPARSAVSAPSVLASHTQTAAGSGPAGASPPSPRRLASLVTEQRTVKMSGELRQAFLKAGVEGGEWGDQITWGSCLNYKCTDLP